MIGCELDSEVEDIKLNYRLASMTQELVRTHIGMKILWKRIIFVTASYRTLDIFYPFKISRSSE